MVGSLTLAGLGVAVEPEAGGADALEAAGSVAALTPVTQRRTRLTLVYVCEKKSWHLVCQVTQGREIGQNAAKSTTNFPDGGYQPSNCFLHGTSKCFVQIVVLLKSASIC